MYRLLKLIVHAKKINWILADQALVSGVNFVTGLVLARYLGIEDFGVFTLCWMSILFLHGLQYALIVSPMMSIGPKISDTKMSLYTTVMSTHVLSFLVICFFVLFCGLQIIGMIYSKWDAASLGGAVAFSAVTFLLQDYVKRFYIFKGKLSEAF
ncbi:MAG: hypothetical protein OEW87_09810, partial [Flavobacteriaceae bacterium]|nr:hypothetical protein [Flavobacteriaceae bacterium]